MSIRIVFLDRATIASYATLRRPSFAHEWLEYEQTNEDDVVERLKDCDIVITNKVALRKRTLSKLPELRMIAVAATGTDVIDLEYCRERDIVVRNIQDYATTSVPEHVVALMLALRRGICAYQQDVHAGEWQKAGRFCFFNHPLSELAGSTLGIIGNGSLGQGLARLGSAMGMKLLLAERKGSATLRQERVAFADLLARSDVISLHCPLNPDTHNLIAKKELRQMKKTALLINTARGGLVNERDLAQALQEQTIAGAGFDVLTEEPPQDDHPLLQWVGKPNFILTPHVAWASQQAMQTLADQLIDNIERFVKECEHG